MKAGTTTLCFLSGLALVLLTANPATADVDGTATTAGIETVVTRVVLDRARNGLDLETGAPDLRVYEYTSVTDCSMSTPGGANADVPCLGAIQACAGNTPAQGLGPQVRLYRRELGANGQPVSASWGAPLGTTCFPDLVPGKQVLGMGLILAAFHNTAFAKPTVHIQPEGNVTLVTLATYFEVNWPDAGFQPDEVDPVTLMGQQVLIRPTNVGFTYVFGDLTTSGPTLSPGGIYPDGDITHAYSKAGVYDSHIDITYGGEYSYGGSGWLPILDNGGPATVDFPGSRQLLTVKTARARLVIK
jgi:hypothetical protein